jgi:hypothetical protein
MTFEEDMMLVDEHWNYIESLLRAHGESPDVIKKIQFHYKTAFMHGIRHEREKHTGV